MAFEVVRVLLICLVVSCCRALQCIQLMSPSKVIGFSCSSRSLLLKPAVPMMQLRYSIDDFIEQNVHGTRLFDSSVYVACRSIEGLQVSDSSDSSEIVVLVDLAVRSFDDIEWMEKQDSRYRRLVSKCKGLGDDLSKDKFLYTHDVGGAGREMLSIARIPSEMHQKLELSRRLAEAHASSNITVYMIGGGSEVFCDAAMSDAVLSGFQLQRLSSTMPSMKRTAGAATTGSSTSLTLEFILPASMYTTPNNQPTTSPLSDSRSDAPLNYQIQGIPNVETKISALEAAMLEAASKSVFQRDIDDDSPGVDPIAGRCESADDFVQLMRRAVAVNSGTHLTRQLAALPPNILTPGAYSKVLQSVAKARNLRIEEWSADQLRSIGCGAFYAVTQADQSTPDKFGRLVRLSTAPSADRGPAVRSLSSIRSAASPSKEGSDAGPSYLSDKPIVLVGKGVCYDTGGINLKTAGSMKGMKADMAGSAAALGAFLALQISAAEDQSNHHPSYRHPIECWLALSENNANSLSFRPDDVLTAVTGDSIEVVHSDAEGRLLLADVLALASRKTVHPLVHGRGLEAGTPALLLDFATLTGTCITSLSTRYIGAFTNKPALVNTIIEVGAQCGERVWPFPLDSDFEEDLRSDIADLLQCRVSTEADHIYAAAFLNRFVKATVPWIHLDLASAHRPGGLGHVGSDLTGSGARLAVHVVRAICNNQ